MQQKACEAGSFLLKLVIDADIVMIQEQKTLLLKSSPKYSTVTKRMYVAIDANKVLPSIVNRCGPFECLLRWPKPGLLV